MSGAAARPPPVPLALKAYAAGLVALEPAVAGLLALRRRRGKEDPARLGERKGHAAAPRPPGPLVWMHGASVGETLALLPLAEALAARGLALLVTSGTRTSAELLARRLPPGALHHYAPVDATRYVARFLAHWRPDLALVAESEIWPNMILALARAGTPLVLVNARLSERSARGWSRTPAVAAALFGRIALCLAQTRPDADRLTAAGAKSVAVSGNLKLDAPAPPADPIALATLKGLVSGRPLLLAASTHPGEEAAVVAAHRALAPRLPRLLTVIVPRHPARGAEVEALAHGLRTARRSRGEEPGPGIELYVADTLGELGLFYRLATVAFIGGSLMPRGGQNPVEAVRLGAAIVHGPHVGNFAEAYAALDRAGAAEAIAGAEGLADALGALIADPATARRRARTGEDVLAGLTGAVGRTLAALEPYLPPVAATPAG